MRGMQTRATVHHVESDVKEALRRDMWVDPSYRHEFNRVIEKKESKEEGKMNTLPTTIVGKVISNKKTLDGVRIKKVANYRVGGEETCYYMVEKKVRFLWFTGWRCCSEYKGEHEHRSPKLFQTLDDASKFIEKMRHRQEVSVIDIELKDRYEEI